MTDDFDLKKQTKKGDPVLQEIVTLGCERLGMDVGIISHISDDVYTVVAIDTQYPEFALFDEYELENTYCRTVVKDAETCIFPDVAKIDEMLKHPVYLATQLRAYIGTPVKVNRQVWGTLNYSSRDPRQGFYTPEEISFIEE